jgi:hypothetical protein
MSGLDLPSKKGVGSSGFKWRGWLPILVGLHLVASFTFFMFFMPNESGGAGFGIDALAQTVEQVRTLT